MNEYIKVNPIGVNSGGGGSSMNFLATINAPLTNVTGDGTIYQLVWPNIVFNNGSGFNGGSFIAPVAGLYLFSATVSIEGITSAHTAKYVSLVTNSGVYNFNFQESLAEDAQSLTVTMMLNLAINDFVYINVTVAGGAKVIDITGLSSYCFFSGSLI
jgi:C1q domain